MTKQSHFERLSEKKLKYDETKPFLGTDGQARAPAAHDTPKIKTVTEQSHFERAGKAPAAHIPGKIKI